MSHLTRAQLDVARLVSTLTHPTLGGTVVFLGSVRQGPDDGPVVAIEYSAYDQMAEAEIERILAEAEARWPASRTGVEHRLGLIPVGEASIAVVAASPHRGEAFETARWIIEEIKRRLPIWKKEMFVDGTADWRGSDGTTGPAPL